MAKAPPKPAKIFDGWDESVELVGVPRQGLGDAYHVLLRQPWWVDIGLFTAFYMTLNVGFALVYMWTDGVANARAGSFLDYLFFSVQTMGTIGYGAMYPKTVAANALVTAESIVGIIVVALATGLAFAKFSVLRPAITFSRVCVVSLVDGVPTLMFRVGNRRSNRVVEAQVRLTLMQRHTTEEGALHYRMLDLALVRDRSPAFTRSWTVFHRIDERSPFFGKTPAMLKAIEAELIVSLLGIDETSSQTIHARYSYLDDEMIWGARFADIMSELPGGRVQIDLRRFHDVVPLPASAAFPYPPVPLHQETVA